MADDDDIGDTIGQYYRSIILIFFILVFNIYYLHLVFISITDYIGMHCDNN